VPTIFFYQVFEKIKALPASKIVVTLKRCFEKHHISKRNLSLTNSLNGPRRREIVLRTDYSNTKSSE